MSQARIMKFIGDSASYATLVILSVFTLLPLVWMFASSLKTPDDLMKNSDSLIPEKITFFYFNRVLNNTDFLQFMWNSILVALATTVISMTLSSFAAYAVVRFYPKLGRIITRTLIIAYMFPPILLVVPYFMVVSSLGLTNTFTGLILTYLSFSIPFCIWLLTGYFRSIPIEIEEAARIDGASRWKTFISIVLPLASPGMVATAIFTLINAWNEFLFALVLINTGSKKTVSVALYSLVGGDTMEWGDMMAASVMVVVPSLLFFFIIQRHIANGLTGGAVK